MPKSTHHFLPHHRVPAYSVALQLLDAVKAANITDRKLQRPRPAGQAVKEAIEFA